MTKKKKRIPVDLSKVKFEVGDKVTIHDRKMRDHQKDGEIVAIDKLEQEVYQVLLDVVEKNEENPLKVNKTQRTVGMFSTQLLKRES